MISSRLYWSALHIILTWGLHEVCQTAHTDAPFHQSVSVHAWGGNARQACTRSCTFLGALCTSVFTSDYWGTDSTETLVRLSSDGIAGRWASTAAWIHSQQERVRGQELLNVNDCGMLLQRSLLCVVGETT